ncbi:tRNA guanosine(15) transglycosylase TgtA [[Eubacterium] cellulosolvens]
MIGSFEIKEKDLLGRIGKLTTKSGVLETPSLFPVINPLNQIVPVQIIKEKLGFKAIMTNAYLMKKNIKNQGSIPDVHQHLHYDQIIATDSGAYQILVYGQIEVNPKEIVDFQEKINTDIGIILDIPTGFGIERKAAKVSVDQTLSNAEISLKNTKRSDILWVGPVQGGKYLDLVAYSAKNINKHPFPMVALGSPTQIMERHLYKTLVDMMMTAKMNISLNKPIHLFGAGHPSMFALAIACGYDTFDSAAYALYAKDDRYMTPHGTLKLKDIHYFPCSCNVCKNTDPADIKKLPKEERAKILAEHNLWVCKAEIRNIKQAITEGRLWEHIHIRAHSHPSLYAAFKKFTSYENFLTRHSPLYKKRGILYFSTDDYHRPEITYYHNKLERDYTPPKEADTLILFPQFQKRFKSLKLSRENARNHICLYGIPFGIIPQELEQVYPLSQVEIADTHETGSIHLVADVVLRYIEQHPYKEIILFVPQKGPWGHLALTVSKLSKKKGIKLDLKKYQITSS